MTPKQALLDHLTTRHPNVRLTKRATWKGLQYTHAQEHHRCHLSHLHEGSNTGPGDRPRGWYTGEGVVERV